MQNVFESNQRLVKKDLLALRISNAVLPPILIPIPVIPLEADTIVQFVIDAHDSVYIIIIYIA